MKRVNKTMAKIMIMVVIVFSFVTNLLINARPIHAAVNSGNVVRYTKELGTTLSSTYSVTVNGTSVPVYNNNEISYIHFSFAGEVDVVVTVNETVSSYTLSPKSFGIISSQSGQNISFTLVRPSKLILSEVNSLTEKLAIFADPLEENAAKIGNAGVIDASTYSSIDKTGNTESTRGIENAIDAVANNRVLYFPAGKYIFETIYLKSNMTMYIEGGATPIPEI